MEKTITKDILKNELYAGARPAVELLYTRYSGMLFSYILQFVPDRAEAGELLAEIFFRLPPQLQEAFDSSLSIYCWLQVEARKIILEHTHNKNGRLDKGVKVDKDIVVDKEVKMDKAYFFSLLEEASPEHQWTFRQLFIYGRKKEELAAQSGMDLTHVSRVLRECLLFISKNLG